jgi:hypothetical protein
VTLNQNEGSIKVTLTIQEMNMKRSQAEVLLDTKDVIKSMPRQQAVNFVRSIVEQLNDKHGDSFNERDGFEFATLYFP